MNRKTAVKCIESGEEFGSIAEAARVRGCSAANISKAIRKGGIAVGGHWRYTTDMSKAKVIKARGTVCNTCCVCGPMADDTKVDWCATCPVRRIDLSALS